MEMIDCHCHLSDERIFEQADSMIKRALREGINRIALGGVELPEWKRQLQLKKKYPKLILTNFGIHPWWVEKYSDADLETMFASLAQTIDKADGVGETGLDFGIKRSPEKFELQEKYFRKHIQLAITVKKPMVLHLVTAHERAQQILREEIGKSRPKMMIHRYSGSAEQMRPYLDMGAYISFSGEIAASRGHTKSKEAFLAAPLNRILMETDAPDQGKEPSDISQFYRVGASLKEITSEKLKEIVAENFSQIY